MSFANRCAVRLGLAGWLVAWLLGSTTLGTVVTTQNGLVLEGDLGYLSSIDEDPLVANVAPNAAIRNIVLLDDGLRRTYLPRHLVDALQESPPGGEERIEIRQRVAKSRRYVGSVTAILNVTPFDKRGRRVFSLLTPRGELNVFQGITEITPLYTKVEGLIGDPSITWDCRVATSSIPREILSSVIRKQATLHGVDARLATVRLLFDAERYRDAQIELQRAINEYPELGKSPQLDNLLVELRQYSAERLVDEIQLRKQAGQHQRVRSLLQQFPADGVASETLQRVSQLLREYQNVEATCQQLKDQLNQLVKTVQDPAWKQPLETVQDEIDSELGINTVGRLMDFQRLQSDAKMTDDIRLSLIVSGWILGVGNATQNLGEAVSIVRTRRLVRQYLVAGDQAERQRLLAEIGREEGGTPARVLQIIRHLVPPRETTEQPSRPPGNFSLTVPGIPDGTIHYEVQLPDEYDPYRRYPAIVTLHASGRAPSDQIDWWSGAYDSDREARVGQGMRHGYIVIAPQWLPEGNRRYEYSGREHASVVVALRDACRRFSIDTDRVFLSGHSVGGDAAWDIGLAHPDLWAGVIPIVAVADYGPSAPKYVSQYWPNASHVPLYFVMGELDGDKLERNRRDLHRYLKRGAASHIDVMVTEFIGRGHEHFYDEIHRLFDWMAVHRRTFQPREYECVTMRTFDNFFFNLELSGLPKPTLVNPYQWPAKNASPSVHQFKLTEVGTISVKTGAVKARLWLTPETIELDGRLAISVNHRSRTYEVMPDVATLLEDARTRADRQHPFWASVELITGNRPVAR